MANGDAPPLGRGKAADPPLNLAQEVEIIAIRSQGPGGQNVNKVSNAVHLRFDVRLSSLPDDVKDRLLALADRRISKDGIVIIKSQSERSLELNKAQAFRRLQELIGDATAVQAQRKATKPTYGSRLRRLEAKGSRSQVKSNRAKVHW